MKPRTPDSDESVKRQPSSRRRRPKNSGPLALLLTHSGDFYTIDRVQAALVRLGWDAVRFNTDTFPLQASMTVEVTKSGVDWVVELPSRQFRMSDVQAVWLRRIWAPTLPEHLSADDLSVCDRTAQVMLNDLLAHGTAPHCKWVNPLEASTRAESKLLQLRLAHELGFDLPDTVVTNEPGWVERLREEHPRLITKLLVPLSYAMQSSRFFYTTEVPKQTSLSGLKYRPQIFQPLIEKARELRVVVVGNEIFTASIDASQTLRGQLDWRQLDASEAVEWIAEDLPKIEERRVRRLLTRLGLSSGAIDFIVTPEGRYVFLEVNPAGEWGWLERDLGFDISGAFARTLTTKRPRR